MVAAAQLKQIIDFIHFYFNNALELFLSKLAAAGFCDFEYISKNLHDCT